MDLHCSKPPCVLPSSIAQYGFTLLHTLLHTSIPRPPLQDLLSCRAHLVMQAVAHVPVHTPEPLLPPPSLMWHFLAPSALCAHCYWDPPKAWLQHAAVPTQNTSRRYMCSGASHAVMCCAALYVFDVMEGWLQGAVASSCADPAAVDP